MTKTKSTKRALMMSALSLLLCVSMLIGTTYAWFTDSVTSTGNKIVAGTLEVDLLMADANGDYASIADQDAAIFGADSLYAQNNAADTLWEPGKTQVAYLAIKNNGNLALKYKVALNVKNVNKALYEAMEYAIIADAQNGSVKDWIGGNSVVEGMQTVSSDVSLAVGATHYFALAIHMNEEAGNEYQGGEVDFDLTVLATQDTVESDSFDNQYDKDADYVFSVETADTLSAALLNGGTIRVSPTLTEWVLTKDEVLPEGSSLVFENDFRIVTNGHTLELQGATITIDKTLTLDGTLTVGAGNSTISGNGTIVRATGKTMLNCQTENSSLTVSGITLDGGSIDVASSKTPIVMIRKGTEVNIVNNAIVQNSISTKDGSAAFNVGLGTLNLDGAVIRNNKLTAAKGGAVYIRDGAVVNVKNTEVYGNTGKCGGFIGEDNQQGGCTVNIYSGNIHDNTSLDAGHSGVIYLRKTSVVNIYGGNFSNNSGIYSQDTGNATLNIMGGTFDSTNADYFGGNNADSTITLSGGAKILANDTGLVFANGNAAGLTDDILYIIGALNEDANIQLNAASIEHILSRTDGYIAKGLNYTITENDVAKFSCEGYTFKLDATNNTITVVK